MTRFMHLIRERVKVRLNLLILGKNEWGNILPDLDIGDDDDNNSEDDEDDGGDGDDGV